MSIFDENYELLRSSIFDTDVKLNYNNDKHILSFNGSIGNIQTDYQLCIIINIIVNTYPEVLIQPVQYKHLINRNIITLKTQFLITDKYIFRDVIEFDLEITDVDLSINYDIIRKLSSYIPPTFNQYYSIHSDIISKEKIKEIYSSSNKPNILINNYNIKSFHISFINLYVRYIKFNI